MSREEQNATSSRNPGVKSANKSVVASLVAVSFVLLGAATTAQAQDNLPHGANNQPCEKSGPPQAKNSSANAPTTSKTTRRPAPTINLIYGGSLQGYGKTSNARQATQIRQATQATQYKMNGIYTPNVRKRRTEAANAAAAKRATYSAAAPYIQLRPQMINPAHAHEYRVGGSKPVQANPGADLQWGQGLTTFTPEANFSKQVGTVDVVERAPDTRYDKAYNLERKIPFVPGAREEKPETLIIVKPRLIEER